MITRLVALAALVTGLSACASTLPGGGAPVAQLYSFETSARFMLRDVCLPAAIDGVPVATRTDVSGVYPVAGSANAWRTGPGGAARVIDEGPGACTVTASRGTQEQIREGLIAEIERSPAGFLRVGGQAGGSVITDTFCARRPIAPRGLSVLMRTERVSPPGDAPRVSAAVRPRPDLCG